MKHSALAEVNPAGRFDSALMVQEGNRQVFELMGEYLYSPLYKIVLKKDIKRLQEAVKSCSQEESVDECVQLLNAKGEYEKFIVSVRRHGGAGDYYIEFQNVSVNKQQMKSLKNRLSAANDFLTIAGGFFFTYVLRTNRFQLFWVNYEQKVDVYNGDLDEWIDMVTGGGLAEGQDKEVFDTFCQALREAGHGHEFRFRGRILTKGGSREAYRIKLVPRSYEQEAMVVGAWMVVNEQTGNEVEDYVEGTYVDPLTRILNKRAITEYAEEAVSSGGRLALVMIDIDNFKDVNDTYGHLFGDQVIAATADIVKKVVGEKGVVGRIGGDEFMAVLEKYEDEADLRNYLRTIKTGMASLFQDRMNGSRLSCSIGAARAGVDADDYKGLFRIADKALYIAKQKGRNRFVIYKPELHGQFNVSGDDFDMTEIRDSFYSDKDMNRLNELLADVVINGSSCLPRLLEHAAHTLMVDRLIVIWGEKRTVIAAYPEDYLLKEECHGILEGQQYLEMFKDDMLMITNVNMLEYSIPEAHALFCGSKVLSLMQHLLRDGGGRRTGMILAEECTNMRCFPKLAVQLFENMCHIVNAVLVKEGLDK